MNVNLIWCVGSMTGTSLGPVIGTCVGKEIALCVERSARDTSLNCRESLESLFVVCKKRRKRERRLDDQLRMYIKY